VLPCGAFVDVQLALGAVEAPTTRALPRSHTTTAILTRTLANGCFFWWWWQNGTKLRLWKMEICI